MNHLKNFNEELTDKSFKSSDKEITDFIDWVVKYCTDSLTFKTYYHKSRFEDMPSFYLWFFNTQFFSNTEEFIKNNRNSINTIELYNHWYKEQNDESLIKPTLIQKINYDFTPSNFLEYLAKNNYWLFRSNYNGVQQPSYWTKGNNGKGKFTLDELFNQFRNS